MKRKISLANAKYTSDMMLTRIARIDEILSDLAGEVHPDVIAMKERLRVERATLIDARSSLMGDFAGMKIRTY